MRQIQCACLSNLELVAALAQHQCTCSAKTRYGAQSATRAQLTTTVGSLHGSLACLEAVVGLAERVGVARARAIARERLGPLLAPMLHDVQARSSGRRRCGHLVGTVHKLAVLLNLTVGRRCANVECDVGETSIIVDVKRCGHVPTITNTLATVLGLTVRRRCANSECEVADGLDKADVAMTLRCCARCEALFSCASRAGPSQLTAQAVERAKLGTLSPRCGQPADLTLAAPTRSIARPVCSLVMGAPRPTRDDRPRSQLARSPPARPIFFPVGSAMSCGFHVLP